MADVKKQGIWIKSCFKLDKTAAETHRMLKESFGEQALSQARTFEWFKPFKDGCERSMLLVLASNVKVDND